MWNSEVYTKYPKTSSDVWQYEHILREKFDRCRNEVNDQRKTNTLNHHCDQYKIHNYLKNIDSIMPNSPYSFGLNEEISKIGSPYSRRSTYCSLCVGCHQRLRQISAIWRTKSAEVYQTSGALRQRVLSQSLPNKGRSLFSRIAELKS